MTEQIKDGKGTGKLAQVNSDNKLEVHSISESELEFINSHNEDAYIQYIDVTPTAANDVFLYIKNTHQTKQMEINWYRAWTASAAEAVDIYINHTGTPSGTTTLVPCNTNITSNNSATGDFYEGVDITGLSGGTLFGRVRINGDGKDVVNDFPGKIIIDTGGVITFQALNGAIPIELAVSFHYKNRE